MCYRYLFIVVAIFYGTTVFANEKFCDNLDGVKKLRSFLTCQGSLQLVACGGLGGAALGYGVSKAAKLYSAKGITKSKLTSEKLAEEAYDIWRKGLKPENQQLINKVKKDLKSIQSEISKIESDLNWRKLMSNVPSENFIGGTKESFLGKLTKDEKKTFDRLEELRNKKSEIKTKYSHIVRSNDRIGVQKASIEYQKLTDKRITRAHRRQAKKTSSYDVSKTNVFAAETKLGYLSDDPKLKGQKMLQLSVKAFEEIPDGTVVYGLGGERKIKGIDLIDLDTRGGLTWWGLKDEDPAKFKRTRVSGTIYKPKFVNTPKGRVDVANSFFDDLPADYKKKFKDQVNNALKGKVKAKTPRLRKFLRGLSGRAGMLAGGALGVGLSLAGELISGKQTACAEIGDEYINLNKNCQPDYSFNQNVLKTLEMSDGDLKEALKTQKVCDFYKTLHDKNFKNYEVQGATCEGRKIIANVKHPDSNIPISYTFLLSDNGGLNKIEMDGIYNSKKITVNLSSENEMITSYSGKIDGALETENVIASDMAKMRFHPLVSGVNKRIKDIKLFYPELKECCKSGFPGCRDRFKMGKVSSSNDKSSVRSRRTRGAN